MQGVGVLILLALVTTFGILWLLTYFPIFSTFGGKPYSPRLAICKVLVPFDILTTLIPLGAVLGIGGAISGIGTLVFTSIAGLGVTLGVVIVDKILRPKWRKQYDQFLLAYKEELSKRSINKVSFIDRYKRIWAK